LFRSEDVATVVNLRLKRVGKVDKTVHEAVVLKNFCNGALLHLIGAFTTLFAFTTSVVDPDPEGSETFCRIRIRN
jgi:hypothetical protein